MKNLAIYPVFDDKRIELFSKISFAMLVLYFLDILLLGTGEATKIGFFSTRILFFGLAGLFSLPLLFNNVKSLIRQPYVVAVAVFMIWVAISAIRGVISGNNLSIIKTDIFGFLNFCILPTMVCVLNNKHRITVLLKCIVTACIAMAIATIILSFFPFFSNQGELYRFLQDTGIAAITVMDGVATRVFFHTATRYFLVSYLIILAWLLNSTDKKQLTLGMISMSLLLVGIFMSYSRAPYAASVLSVFIFAIIVFFINREKLKKMVCLVLVPALLAVAIIGAVSTVQKYNLFKPAIYRVLLSITYEAPGDTLPPADPFDIQEREVANLNVRQSKLTLLKASIAMNPVFGNGLGAAIGLSGGYVEYVYHDFANKIGFFGLFLFFLPFLIHIGYILKRSKLISDTKHQLIKFALFASVTYFLFISYFNPCMNTTVGISCYVLSMAIIGGSHSMSDLQKTV